MVELVRLNNKDLPSKKQYYLRLLGAWLYSILWIWLLISVAYSDLNSFSKFVAIPIILFLGPDIPSLFASYSSFKLAYFKAE